MKKESKAELARMLYLTTEKSQKEICRLIGWTEKTFTQQKQSGNWEEMRDSKGFSKQQIITLLHTQTLRLVEHAREENRLLTAREIDSIAKLASSIEKMENRASIETYIEVFTEYNKWISNQDIEFAKANNIYQDKFILSKIPK